MWGFFMPCSEQAFFIGKKKGNLMKNAKFTIFGSFLIFLFALIFVFMPWILEKEKMDDPSQKVVDAGRVEKDQIHIGLLQLMSHPSLDEIRQGIYDGLSVRGYEDGKNIMIHYENGQGDQNNLKMMSDYFVSESMDFLVGIATPAAQALENASGGEIPLIFSAVTDPLGAGLVDSLDKPNRAVTGTSDDLDVRKQVDLLLELLPNVQSIGIMHDSASVNVEKIVDSVVSYASSKRIEVVVRTVTSTNDIQQVAEQLAKEVEALWLPNDNTIASSMSSLVPIFDEAKIPIFPSVEAMVKEGGLATLGVNQYQIGIDTANVLADIIEGKDPSTYPVLNSVKNDIYVNGEKAKSLSIKLNKEFLDRALDISKGDE